jgi:vitamin B12/bleomycin/antimicrobial peptide transport system ATP-binding/permease protein
MPERQGVSNFRPGTERAGDRGERAISLAQDAALLSQRQHDDLVRRYFVPVATGYWRGPTRLQAWALLLALGLTVLLGIAGNVGFSMWNRWFFDGLEQRNAAKLGWSLLALLGIVFAATANEVCLVLSRETLQVRWRAWFTRHVTDRWLARQRYYHLNAAGKNEASVPEYRIADDIRWATEPVMDFYIGILGATVSIVSFAGILWVVGGALKIGGPDGIGGDGFTIPGYMVIAGVFHAGALTLLMLYCGRALPRNMAARNEAEAHFRLSLMRLRENADSVAMARGEDGERAILRRGLDHLVRRWLVVVRQDGQLAWILKANTVMQPVVPLLLATPKFLSGELSLGAVMQLASAYVPFQAAIAWAFDNYKALSIWHASARRIGGLLHSMGELDSELDRADRQRIAIAAADAGGIQAAGLTVAGRDGAPMIRDIDLAIRPGEKLLLAGESGTGKSTLARAIVGLWPWGSGTVTLPREARVGFVPQRAYLPLGSLRDALAYPLDRLDASDAAIVAALVRCGIGDLAPRLDTVERWDQLLSGGERQRLGFARLILQRPDIAVLDDALAALDQQSREEIMALLRHDLPDTIILSVAQQDGIAHLHDRSLTLVKAEGGARLIAVAIPAAANAD